MKIKLSVVLCSTVLVITVSGLVAAWPAIGNKTSVNQERPAGLFSSVHFTGKNWHLIGDCNLLRVEVHIGTEAKLVVSGESNVIDFVNTSINDHELLISLPKFIRPTTPIVISATTVPSSSSKVVGPININGIACLRDMKQEFASLR